MRTVKEWKGKTDDAMPPKGVRDRIFERHNHICHECQLPIVVPKMKWALDHVKAIQEGGENIESNLAPIHVKPCHELKTNAENKRRDKAARQRQAHHGIAAPKQKIQSKGFEKPEKPAKVGKLSLPPRRLYQ